MATHHETVGVERDVLPVTEDERKLKALREAIAEGDASGIVEGDIFLQIAAEYGLSLDDQD